MENDMSDMIKNVKNLVDSGNIPDNLKDIINNLQNSNSTTSDNTNNTNNSNSKNSNSNNKESDNSFSNNITSEDLNRILNSFTGGSGTNENVNINTNYDTNSNNNYDFDINTILKMKSIINAMNKKDDPRTNLLYSLKPYLRDSRKNKLDQYVNMLNITKMADIFKANNKENNNGI